MPSIVYDNIQYISKDAIQCKKCLVIVERKARDEFKWCSCRTLSVDKGRYFAIDEKKKVWLIENDTPFS